MQMMSTFKKSSFCTKMILIQQHIYFATAVKQMKQAQDVECMLGAAGLMDRVEPLTGPTVELLANIQGSAHFWQGILDQKRDAILEARQRQQEGRPQNNHPQVSVCQTR